MTSKVFSIKYTIPQKYFQGEKTPKEASLGVYALLSVVTQKSICL